MTTHRLALKNLSGEVIRVIECPSPEGCLIFNKIEKRIKVIASQDSRQKSNIHSKEDVFLSSFKVAQLAKKPVIIDGIGSLCLLDPSSALSEDSYRKEDDEKDPFLVCLKWSSVTHVAMIVLFFLLGTVLKDALEPEKPTVEVVAQARMKPRPTSKVKSVKVSEKKIQPTKKQANASKNRPKKVGQKTRPKTQPLAQRARPRPKKNLTELGALGALGGAIKGSKHSAGLQLDSAQNSSGTGSQSGSSGKGGNSRALPGKGLVASGIGSGSVAEGAGGYGTRGQGGGRVGYGQHNMIGSSSAYSQPLEEEALVQGGLDRDQVAAVINRNIGQIIFCYEKGLQKNPNLSGRVTMSFEIGTQGRVNYAFPKVSSLRSPLVESCMANKLKGWKFPKPVGNVSVKVTYPFVLKRLSQG